MIGALKSLIDRPVVAVVISVVIFLLGAQAYFSLPIREFPKTTFGSVIVTTPYPGASADVVKGFITTPLERAVSSANGIEYITSSSVQGSSSITARLELNYDPNIAAADILAKVNQVANLLPAEAENPSVTTSIGAGGGAIFLGFQSNVLTPTEIVDLVTRGVSPRLASVAGVQDATLEGTAPIALRVWLDPTRMAALDITPSDVTAALSGNNVISAVGSTDGSTTSLSLAASTNLSAVDEFEDLVIRRDDEKLIRLSDVAEVAFGAESYGTSVTINGAPGVSLAVNASPDANLLDVVEGVRAIFPEIQASLPGAVDSFILYDTSLSVQRSIDGVIQSLVVALIIVTIVIWLFLGSFRSVIIPVVTMPLAIIGSFFLMQVLGFSVNLLTLLALILAIGTIVDDSIIVTENAVRQVADGEAPKDAAKRTFSELGRSVIAMNIVVVAAFVPVGFAGGLTGALFREFAYVVAAATVTSGIVALTLSPMMAAYILRAEDNEKRGPARWLVAGFERLRRGYLWLLDRVLNVGKLVLGIALCIVASVYFLYTGSQSELAPNEDQGFMQIILTGDPNASLEQIEAWTDALTDQLEDVPGVQDWYAARGIGANGNRATVSIVLDNWDDRAKTAQELTPVLTEIADSIAGLQSIVITPDTLPGAAGGAPIQFVITSTDDPRNIYEIAQRVVGDAQASGRFAFLSSDLQYDKRSVTLNIDRERAAALGIDVEQLSGDIATMTSEGFVNFFQFDGSSYRVIPQATRSARLGPDDLGAYYVRAASGELVPLSSLVTLSESVEPRELTRFNQLNSARISAVSAGDTSYGEAIAFLQNAPLPDSYVPDWIGQSRQFTSEGGSLIFTFGLAVAIIYLTLSAQYNSFRDPMVMFITVPLALSGALVFFYAGVVTVNIYTQIGLLALISIIIRHGILLVEFANALQVEEGLDRREAIRKAADIRFRSIIMTTISTIAGMLPLVFAADGPGVQSRFAISFTIIAGMGIGTIFTLFVVPAIYPLLAAKRGTERRAESEPSPA
ncbi:efflux RND transporter permease subunit [uncultured Roseobacter sp.]|uniref:efflux RND transporter permease subunit n=1 Tax=uncultured Roseobacter sp. TaxID=114847 RepID=UPI002639BB9A|nr:efflux RND transporter permease subunit [uncultured Roseobacter sp.]